MARRHIHLYPHPLRTGWNQRRYVAALTIGAGRDLRRVQTGHVQNYALGIAVGLIVMAGSYLLLAGR